MNLKSYREKLEAMYIAIGDTCDVWSKERVFDEETASEIEKKVYVVKDQPCRISQPGLGSSNLGIVNDLDYEMKLFISPDIPIKPGMSITVSRTGLTYTAGDPFPYPTHQEVKLRNKRYA